MLENIAIAITLVSVILTVIENIWCWPTSIVSVILYGIFFYQQKLYADAVLQVIYLLFSIYGWYEWLHGGKDDSPLEVRSIGARTLVLSLMTGAVASALCGFALQRWTDASLPWVDSSLSAFSLVAQWQMTKKYLQNWLIWISVDVIYIGMFAYKQVPKTAALYAVFLALATSGYFKWRNAPSRVTA